MDKNRNIGLDYLRIFAAFSIIVYHFYFSAPLENNTFPVSLLNEKFFFGFYGTGIFFLLSGFLILYSLKNKTVKEFILSRVLRILPVFAICNTLILITGSLWGWNVIGDFKTAFLSILPRYLISFTFSQDLLNINGLSAVYWTLVIEVRFYILCIIIKKSGLWDKYKFKILFLWETIAIFNEIILHNNFLENILILEHAGHFIVGILFYMYIKDSTHDTRLLILSAIAIMLMYNTFIKYRNYIDSAFDYKVDLTHIFVYLLFIIILFYGLASMNIYCNRSASKIIKYISELTYPIYLIHADFVGFYHDVILPKIEMKFGIIEQCSEQIIIIVGIILAILLAMIVNKCANIIVNGLKKNVFYLEKRQQIKI